MSETPNKIVVGVLAAERIVAGLVIDGQMDAGVQHFPPPEDSDAAAHQHAGRYRRNGDL